MLKFLISFLHCAPSGPIIVILYHREFSHEMAQARAQFPKKSPSMVPPILPAARRLILPSTLQGNRVHGAWSMEHGAHFLVKTICEAFDTVIETTNLGT